MLKQLYGIVLLLLLLGNTNSYAQQTPTQIIDQFFEIYKKEPLKAIDFIFSKNERFLDKEKSQVENVKFQLSNTLDMLGNNNGHEFLVKKSFADCFELHCYIVKYDTQPVRFNFKFYKPKDQWITMAFSYDDNILQEIDEAVKLYNILPY